MKALSLKVHALLLTLLAALLLFQLISVQRFDANEPFRIHHLLEQLGRLDSESEQAMMQIYSHSLFDFDQLTDHIGQMRGGYQELALELVEHERFGYQKQALSASLQIQYEGMGEFMASFAILSNSVRYFPTLVAQLYTGDPAIDLMLTQLNRDIYQWQLYPDDQKVMSRIRATEKWAKGLGLAKLNRHLDVILEYTPRTLTAIEKVISCGTPENAHLLAEGFDAYFATEVESNQVSQQRLIVLSVVLLAYLLLLLVFRQRDAVRLSESEKRFHLLFDLIPDGVGVHQGGRWIYCNPAAVKMFGAGFEADLIGTEVVDYVHVSMREEVADRIKLEMEELQPAPLMLQRNLRMDGSEFFGEVQGIPFIENDQPVAMAVIRDVTDRILAESEAEKSRQNLLAVIDNSTAILCQKDLHGHYILINRYFADLLNEKNDDVIGRTDHDLFPAHLADAFRANDLKVIEAGEAMEFEEEIELDDGLHTFISIKVPLKDSDGNVESVFGISTDITILINAEREKAEAQSKIEHVQRLESLGVLAGGIAHDFNNILTAVMGNAALAGRNMDDSSPAKEFLSRIEASTQRASDLCKQMLAYSGKGKFIIKPINLSDLVEDMTRLMEVSIEKNVVIKYHLASNLPLIEADAAQIQQVILNLITNANEAVESKSGIISFSTGVMHADRAYLNSTYTEEAVPEGRYVYLEVSDTGHGMSQETQKKIFDPFFTTKFTGRGLGMSAVLGIVRGHDGTLRVYSEVGKGTTFKVLFPVADHLCLQSAEQTVAESDNWSGQGTILVVDDEETIREVASLMLEAMGFQTLCAVDGEDALRVYRESDGEVSGVLLDMTMPKMDGKECFRELRRMNADVKVVLSSGYNEQDATSRFIGQGLAGFIQKPYSPEELREKIRMLFDE